MLPEIVLTFHCLNKLFKWSQNFSRSLVQFFLTVGQNNFGDKIPFLFLSSFLSIWIFSRNNHKIWNLLFILGCYGYPERLPVVTQIPKNLQIILQTGSCNFQIFCCIVFAWIWTPRINNFLNAKGKKQCEIFFAILHILEIFNFEEKVFSIFVLLSFNLDFLKK